MPKLKCCVNFIDEQRVQVLGVVAQQSIGLLVAFADVIVRGGDVVFKPR